MEDPLLNPIEPSSAIRASGGGGSEDDLGPFPPPPIGLETDPFYAFRDELAHTTRKCLARLEKLKSATSSEEMFAEIAGTGKALASLKENVSHLERVVSHVERKRADFSHLTEDDVKERRAFLKNIQSRVRHMEVELSKAATQAEQVAEQERRQFKQQMEAAKSRSSLGSMRVTREDNAYDLEGQRYLQEQMLREQDQSLDEISTSLGRLHDVGSEMYHEIESQNRLLDEVNEESHGLEGKMDTALNRLDKMLHTKNRGQTMGILFLVVVLLVEIIILSVI